MVDTPSQRAARIVANNRFLTLACADNEGPWAAPINYVIGPGQRLIFYSARESRHSKAIEHDAAIAGAIFDSRASSDDVDGLQFAGRCEIASGATLELAHERYFETNFDSAEDRDWWFRPVEAFSSGGVSAFFQIDLSDVWVIDFESVETNRIDRRLDVNLSDLWGHLEADRKPG